MSGTRGDWDGILAPGEKILWQGRPEPGLSFRGLDPRRVLFGLAMLAIAVFWTLGAARATSDAPLVLRLLFPLVGVLFIAQGARLAGGARVWQAWLRARSWYSLSNRRAFIATEIFGRRGLNSWPITADTAIGFDEGPPASVYFADAGSRFGRGGRVGFERISEGREVLNLMRRIQRGAA
ncbi:hypothetical protein [Tropicimonas marinistellae]|uniref:hypothetical protein n=1 Tax=Tropicimonas marinistellae TaxID=1739787 RepID=UPI00082CFC2F|nr:hypothetical protein [Tropicimonas marinistellae]